MRPITFPAPPAVFAVYGRPVRVFHVCGGVGLLGASAMAAGLTHALGLSPTVMVASGVAGVVVLVGLTYVTTLVLGREVIVNYHHLVAVTAAAALVARAAAVPVGPHLAAFAVALMVFQGCGRLGCVSAGCCHGRPAQWGVRYGGRHVAAGFPVPLVDVPLLPTQLMEAAWAFAIAAGGAVLLRSGVPPRDVIVTVAAAYAVGRLGIEFLRGDTDRPRFGGLSEAQWTSLALLFVAAVAAWVGGAAPRIAVAALAAVATSGALVWLLLRWRVPVPERQLFDPDHILELAGAVAIVCEDRPAADIHVATTSLGVTVSGGSILGAARTAHHYTISCDSHVLSARAAQRLAGTILVLRHPGGSGTIVPGRRSGTFHLVAMADAPAPGRM